MTKRTNSKYKLDRRMGENIWGRNKSPVNRRAYGPGQHGQRKSRKLSDYGTQLHAKQKLKGYYANITERQFRGYYAEASRKTGDTGEQMIGLLERRLDAVVFRAKFVPTPFSPRANWSAMAMSRVNGKRTITISSELIWSRRAMSSSCAARRRIWRWCSKRPRATEREVPDYIDADHGKMRAKFVRVPKLAEVPYAVQMQPSLVVEFYSR